MKVSFVLYDYFPFGGLQEDCVLTARAMQARGHDVEVVTRTWQGSPPDDLKVQLLGRRGNTNTVRNVNFFQDLDAYFTANPTNCVVAFNRIPNSDVYFSADPCYLEKVKNKPFWYFWTGRHRHYRDAEAGVFTNPNKPEVYCLTDREIETYHRYYGTARERFHLLPPGVARVERPLEEKAGIRAALRAELGVAEEQLVALFVGSDYKRKGVMRNLEALKAAKESGQTVELWVLGADKPGVYQAFAKQHGLSVRFLGGRADVARFYDAADFMLHPAHSESAGKVLLEALTYGLPVVVSGVCGYAKQVGDAGGKVLPEPFVQADLNAALNLLSRDGQLRDQMRVAALDYAATADIYECTTRFAAAIEQNHLNLS